MPFFSSLYIIPLDNDTWAGPTSRILTAILILISKRPTVYNKYGTRARRHPTAPMLRKGRHYRCEISACIARNVQQSIAKNKLHQCIGRLSRLLCSFPKCFHSRWILWSVMRTFKSQTDTGALAATTPAPAYRTGRTHPASPAVSKPKHRHLTHWRCVETGL